MSRIVAVKSDSGEWTLDVLGNPWGGPDNGRDTDGEYFDARTKFHEDKYGLPPIVYYHGYTPDGHPSGEPEYIGRTVSREVKQDGVWYRVVLDKASEFAKRVWEAAQNGLARASSGSNHLHRTDDNGWIREWPVTELSIFDTAGDRQPANSYAVALPAMKAVYAAAGLDLPLDIEPEPEAKSTSAPAGVQNGDAEPEPEFDAGQDTGDTEMEEQEVQGVVAEAVKSALAKAQEEREAAEKAATEEKERTEAAVKAALEAERTKTAEENRLPGGAPYVTKFANTNKYDNLDHGDLSLLYAIVDSDDKARTRADTENMLKSMAVRLAEDTDPEYAGTRSAMKMAGMPLKANELNQSTLANYGDDWVGVTYSGVMWGSIVQDTPVVGRIPAIEVPQGSESIVIPLAGAAPTFYKVAQASAQAANPGAITRTVTTSKMGTGKKTLSVAKLGASTYFTGELEEDSIIPWISELRMSMQQEAAEVLEHVVIDGDTETGATTNINDIGGTPAGTEAFMLFNGFRKSCLITTTANARDGGGLAVGDYLETLKLMGLGGRNVLNRGDVAFIQDVWTGWKALELSEVKTQDVYSAPTIENGQLISIWGRDVITSANMHRANNDATYGLKADSAGKVDLDTAANNLYGAILAVRFDQWRLGWKRRITIETTRVPSADSTEIVALLRVGLVQRDTEASAISYNLTL